MKNLGKKLLSLTKKGNAIPNTNRGEKPILPAVLKALEKAPTHVVDGVTNVFSQVTDYLQTAEVETTKRTEIAAKRDVAIEALQNQRTAFELLMKLTFQERAAVIQKQFDVLDRAMASGDVSTVKSALDGMVAVIQSSPFKSIQEMQMAMGSKDFVVRLE
ncbi:hypothetical protein OPU71_17405 [Niveibacterium sp. 24ML]|uniref:hypothetical protein n=1 Tax=Niveibacterium sp. 24ML TaxID=2985512 RepID=UPI00226E2CF7|nr:hypothetical protein [Niveibacterium sp. 24ML]MCX9157904.1 hypothetical protein [Niveibacterium sp. 24ML]